MADADVTGRISVELDNTKAAEGAKKVEKVIADMEKKVDQQLATIEKGVQQIGTALDTTSKKAKGAADQLASASKKGAGALTEAAKQRRQLAVAQEVGTQRRETEKTEQRELGRRRRSEIRARGKVTVAEQEAKSETKVIEGEQRRQTATHIANEKLRVDETRRATRARIALNKQESKEMAFAAKQASPWYTLGWQARTGKVPASQLFTASLSQQIGRTNLQQQMGQQAILSMRGAGGLSPSQTWQQQMNQAVARSNAANAAFFAQQNQAAAAGGGGRAAGGGLLRRLMGAGGGGIAGGFISGLAGGMGIGLGGYAVARAGGALIEAQQTAVAYERQRLAAANLAGSQEKLNQLLETYTKASGGAIDKTTTLANVTRLLSTGYAETVPEVERFVRATRGASIALGKPQEYVIQETQLAISNVSIKRLDQIGLGIEEVQNRIKELRKENSGWNREMAFQEAVLGLMEEKYRALTDSVEGQATEVEKLAKNWRDLGLAIGEASRGPMSAGAELLNKILESITKQIKANQELATQAERQGKVQTGIQFAWGKGFQPTYMQLPQKVFSLQDRIDRGMTYTSPTIGGGYIGGPEGYQVGPAKARFRDDQLAVMQDYYDQFAKLERDYARTRLNEVRQYEEQRASLVRNYAKQVAREEQDFQRQRARGLRDYERSIVDLMRDASDREAEMRDDLDDRLEDLREANADRVAEIEEDYREDREKAEKEHRDRLLKAAGQLDAIAVLEERKRWKRENEEREKKHKEALEDQRKSLQKQVDEAKEAFEERLEDARKADAKRLEDMAADRARQLADEDEDRAIAKARAAEDYQDQLDEMDRQHAITLQRLADEAEDNRKVLEDALAADLTAVGIYIEGYLEKMKTRDEAIEKWFDKIVEKLEKVIEQEEKPAGPPPAWPKIKKFQSGGPVPFTGLAMLHAGEYVLPASASVSNSSASYNNRNVVFESGAIQVQTVPGSEYMVADLVEERLVALLGAI